MFDDEKDYLGEHMRECPNCGHRYNKHLHGNKCPDCGYYNGKAKYVPILLIVLFVIVVAFWDKFTGLIGSFNISTRVDRLFNRVDPLVSLIVINVVLYFIGFNSDNSDKYGNSYFDTFKCKEFHRLLTSGFSHADLLHLACNMFSLYNLGSFVLSYVGALKFLVIYFVSMIIGGICSMLLHHKFGNDYIRSVGASGAICGLLGFYVVFLIKSPMPELLSIQYIFKAVFPLTITAFNPRIDNLGHICGLVVGIIFSFFLLTSMSFVSNERNSSQTVITNKDIENVVQIVIYDSNYTDNVIKNGIYVRNIEDFNSAVDKCLDIMINQVYVQADHVSKNISILETIKYGEVNVIESEARILNENEIVDYLLYGDNGEPTVTFVTTCSGTIDGQDFVRIFYNGKER